jgi:trehalose 6-phosphate phosphatase
MRYLLASRHLSTLTHFASSAVVLTFDYDGTLAPITGNPGHARLRDRTRRLLIDAARRYPCVVISGRARDDVKALLRGVPVKHVIGNHGLEPWARSAVYVKRVRRWLDELERSLPPYAGVFIENKIYSLAIHYRHVQKKQKRLVIRAINEAVAGLTGSRTIGGKEVINVVPRSAPHKGMALERARRLLACDRAIYVGDDDTDEDVFSGAPPERLLSVRVGIRRSSNASYYLKTQLEIDALLSILVRLRKA